MKLEILNIYDYGGSTERITFVARENTNLNQYVVVDKGYDLNDNLINNNRHSFWFPDQLVKANEWVRLFSGLGKYICTKEVRGGQLKTIHNFYWNLSESVWTKDGDEAVLIHLSDFVKQTISKVK